MDADPSDTDATITATKSDSVLNTQNASEIKNEQSESNNGKSSTANSDNGNTNTGTIFKQSFFASIQCLYNIRFCLFAFCHVNSQLVPGQMKHLATIHQRRLKAIHQCQIASQNLCTYSERAVIQIERVIHQGIEICLITP